MSLDHDAVRLHATLCALRTGGRMPTLQARLVMALSADIDGVPGAEYDTPPVARLARQLGVNRGTLHHALAALRRKGWITDQTETVTVRRIVVEQRTVRRITLTAIPADRRRAG